MEDKFEGIKTLVYKHIGHIKIKLDRNTRLYKDLKIDGDDAWDLLREFSNLYNIDMSNFRFNEYFSSEGVDIIGAIVSFISKTPPLKELTIGDLERAIVIGRLE